MEVRSIFPRGGREVSYRTLHLKKPLKLKKDKSYEVAEGLIVERAKK